ncbi:MAG TPA: exopolysaccharide biosynthesis polyprenyl glycosylphosphotransferase [Candidatus Micrarchaeia archaeon]|nr:exopolysaccharide biosynthesis polyprenyl glycosylphosphotransferase [Candidatus Micrarchaeia archaeon]
MAAASAILGRPLLRSVEIAPARNSGATLRLLLAARVGGDAVAVVLAGLAAYAYRFHLSQVPIPGGRVPAFSAYAVALPVLAAVWVVVFAMTGRYQLRRGQSTLDELIGSIGAVALVLVVALALEAAVRSFPYSRLVLAETFVLAVLGFAVERGLIRGLQASLLRHGHGVERTLVVGRGSIARVVVQRLRMFPEYGYQVVGVAVGGERPAAIGATVEAAEAARFPDGIPVHDLERGLGPVLERERVDTVFLALGGREHQAIVELARVCAAAGATVKVVPDVLEIMTSAAVAEEVGGVPLVSLRPSRLVGRNVILKRAFDLVGTALIGLLAGPCVLLLALAVRLTSPGPALYRQERLGQDGRPFAVWKLRSMVHRAEAGTGPVMTSRGDDRRTVVGRFLRRFSLDELPQLWNVLLGEMSLVGPRPERPVFATQFEGAVPRYAERLEVLPGCTGWAQVNDLRQASSIEERILYDLYYVENWSLGFDIKILLLTPWRVLFHHHAY